MAFHRLRVLLNRSALDTRIAEGESPSADPRLALLVGRLGDHGDLAACLRCERRSSRQRNVEWVRRGPFPLWISAIVGGWSLLAVTGALIAIAEGHRTSC